MDFQVAAELIPMNIGNELEVIEDFGYSKRTQNKTRQTMNARPETFNLQNGPARTQSAQSVPPRPRSTQGMPPRTPSAQFPVSSNSKNLQNGPIREDPIQNVPPRTPYTEGTNPRASSGQLISRPQTPGQRALPPRTPSTISSPRSSIKNREGAEMDINTRFYDAARRGLLDIVIQCCSVGADVNSKHGKYGETAVYAAVTRGFMPVVRFLVEEMGADVNSIKEIDGTR